MMGNRVGEGKRDRKTRFSVETDDPGASKTVVFTIQQIECAMGCRTSPTQFLDDPLTQCS